MLVGWQRDRSTDICVSAVYRFDNLLRRLVNDLMIKGFQPDANVLSHINLLSFVT
jgi:hypothetical protein